jgi:plasmid replication initiation protein
MWGLSTLGYIEIEESMMRLNLPIEYRMIKWWKRLFSRLLIEEIENNNFRMYVTPDYYG